MARAPVDLLVVGGGITGAGIARDAALRGFRTALVERGDFGSGTSSRSSRLIHGGLRYLELGDLRLVFEASRERRTLLRIAPHLVWPRSFLFPVHRGSRVPRWKLAAGLLAYDALALFRNVRTHRWLGKRGMQRAEPGLRKRGLLGGARYWDAQCDDARLTLANVRSAYRAGALTANHATALRFEVADGRVRGAHVRDALDGTSYLVRALTVVNATGPWSDLVRADGRRLLQPTKGAHVAVARDRLGNREAVTILSPLDGRVMFVLPWGELSYVGTTDTPHHGPPDDVRVTGEDVVYLLRSANAIFPEARLQPSDVVSTWAALRPLLHAADTAQPGEITREHQIDEAENGLISIVGGKLTTYRTMAAQVVDLVARRLHEIDGRPVAPAAPTDREPLPGGETTNLDTVRAELEQDTPHDLAQYLVRVYGTEAPAVARLARDDDLGRQVVPGHPLLRAQLIHAVRREMAMTLCDLLVRRSHVFYEVAGQGVAQASAVVDLVGPELGWDAARKATELAAYLKEVERNNAFRAEV
jgi:glycerol-3-phosphate dehydrogenase